MARIVFRGLYDYLEKLSSSDFSSIAGKAIYPAAGIIADAIRENIKSLPEKTGATKEGLADALYISKKQARNGNVYVKIGFAGYNENGRPNDLMARVFESGTSKVQKHPFVRPAVDKNKQKALDAMQKVVDEEIKKIMK